MYKELLLIPSVNWHLLSQNIIFEIILDMWQLKMLLQSTNANQKTFEKTLKNCHLLQTKTRLLMPFDLCLLMVESFFECCLSGVEMEILMWNKQTFCKTKYFVTLMNISL